MINVYYRCEVIPEMIKKFSSLTYNAGSWIWDVQVDDFRWGIFCIECL